MVEIPLKNGIVAQVTEPERGMFPATLGGAVEYTVTHFIYSVLAFMGGGLGVFFGSAAVWFLDIVEPKIITYVNPIISELLSNPNLPPWLRGLLHSIQTGTSEIDGVFGGQIIGSTTSGSILSCLEPIFTFLNYGSWANIPIREPDIDTLIALGFRGTYSPAKVKEVGKGLGFRGDLVDGFTEVARPREGLSDFFAMLQREVITPDAVRGELEKRGYLPDTIDRLLKIVPLLVSPGELRTMLFRDLLTPGAFINRLTKMGYTEQDATDLEKIAWQLVTPGDIVALWQREDIGDGALVDRLKEHGYPKELVGDIINAARRLTDITELFELKWREEITEKEFLRRLTHLGFDDKQASEFNALSHRIPGPMDLISMAVREAFDPGFIARHNYMARYPKEFEEWMLKQGFDKEWSEKYWVAHWRLPAVVQAFEMFQREEITENDLSDLLVAHDIAPRWHTPLMNIAYRPLTRVDVRRMFELGVLDEAAVYKSYLHLGYSPENAANMTEFTIKYAAEEDRAASKADVCRAYSEGVLGRGEAKSYLVDMGYPAEWAEHYLQLEDIKRERGLLSIELGSLKTQYVEGIIERGFVFEELGKWNLPDRQVSILLNAWDIEKERMITLPTPAQLEAFLKEDIIGEGEFRKTMEAKHYQPEVVSHFLQEIRAQKAQQAYREEERVRKEEERVRLAEVKTGYEVEKSRLDLEIAELKTALAENNLLLGVIVDPDLMDQIFRQNDDIQVRIVKLQEDKAKAKLAYTQQLRGMVS